MAVTDPKKAEASTKARLAKKTMPKRPMKKVSRVKKVKPPTAAQKLKRLGKATVRKGRMISKRGVSPDRKAKGKVVKQAGRAMKKKGRQTARAARAVKSNEESIRTRKWLS